MLSRITLRYKPWAEFGTDKAGYTSGGRAAEAEQRAQQRLEADRGSDWRPPARDNGEDAALVMSRTEHNGTNQIFRTRAMNPDRDRRGRAQQKHARLGCAQRFLVRQSVNNSP